MATNFPDTTPPALNPDTGLEWAAGDTFDDTAESGLVYVWSPPVWKTSVEAIPETDGRYVNVIGDNMEGNLTLGPDGGPAEITLDASTGNITGASAEFAGDVQMASQNGGPLAGFRNVLINGHFSVWQRYTGRITPPSGGSDAFGVTITSSNLYGCDRWSSRNPNNSGGNVAHIKTNGAKGNGIRLDVAGSTSYQFIQQEIERANITHLSNEEVTLSLVCDRSTVRARVRTYDYNGDLTEVLASTVAPTDLGDNRYSWTFTLPVIGSGTLTAGNELNNDRGMQIVLYPEGLNTVNGTTDFKEVQLEPGPVATPFEHRPIGTELALCQRYYQKLDRFRLYVVAPEISLRYLDIPRPVVMRVSPTEETGTVNSTTVTFSGTAENISVTSGSVIPSVGVTVSDYTADAEL